MGRYHALKPLHLIPPSSQQRSVFLSSSLLSSQALLYSSPYLESALAHPGLKIPAAFLASLHANLLLEEDSENEIALYVSPNRKSPTCSEISSPISTSSEMSTFSDTDLAPPTALRVAEPATDASRDTAPTIGEDGVPILKTWSAVSTDDRAEALHIVADSVAQQRNIASRALIYHPATLALLAVGFALIRNQFYNGENTDYIKIMTTFTGFFMTLLVSFRFICGPYIAEAEKVGTWRWLDEDRSAEEEEKTDIHVLGDHDEILLTKFGAEHIGTIIFRGIEPATSTGSKRTRRAQSPSKQTKMQIRAWTVTQRFRRKEIGTALLEEALKIGREKGWVVGGVEIAENHANHRRILPNMLNGALNKYDGFAQKTLNKVLEAQSNRDKSRKK